MVGSVYVGNDRVEVMLSICWKLQHANVLYAYSDFSDE